MSKRNEEPVADTNADKVFNDDSVTVNTKHLAQSQKAQLIALMNDANRYDALADYDTEIESDVDTHSKTIFGNEVPKKSN